jgi:hypothetical protein
MNEKGNSETRRVKKKRGRRDKGNYPLCLGEVGLEHTLLSSPETKRNYLMNKSFYVISG